MKFVSNENDYRHAKLEGGRGALWIKCSTCEEEEYRLLPSGSPTCQQQFADKMFRNKHWRLGRNRQEDVCPSCVRKAKEAKAAELTLTEAVREALQPTMIPQPELVAETYPVESNIPVPASARTVMLNQFAEERAFIADFLKEVLIDNEGRKVYPSGWTDQRVAEEISKTFECGRGRILALRQEIYGRQRRLRGSASQATPIPTPTPEVPVVTAVVEPSPTVEQVRMLEEQVRALQQHITGEIAKITRGYSMLVDRINDFQTSFEELEGEWEAFAEPMAISPRTIFKMFKGQARVTQSPKHPPVQNHLTAVRR